MGNHKKTVSYSVNDHQLLPLYNRYTMSVEQKEETVHVVVTFECKPEKYDDFIAAVKPMVIATNKEKGCIRYNIHQDKKNKCKLVIVEEWSNQKCLTAHLKQEHVKTFNLLQKEQEMAKVNPNIYFCGGPVIKL